MYLKVSDILDNNLKPELSRNDDFKTVIDTISKNLLGAAVVTENKKPVGIITDGDIRRAFNKSKNISKLLASDLMSPRPLEINSGILATNALDIMNKNKITQLVVVDNGMYIGLIHLHNIIKEGLV